MKLLYIWNLGTFLTGDYLQSVFVQIGYVCTFGGFIPNIFYFFVLELQLLKKMFSVLSHLHVYVYVYVDFVCACAWKRMHFIYFAYILYYYYYCEKSIHMTSYKERVCIEFIYLFKKQKNLLCCTSCAMGVIENWKPYIDMLYIYSVQHTACYIIIVRMYNPSLQCLIFCCVYGNCFA